MPLIRNIAKAVGVVGAVIGAGFGAFKVTMPSTALSQAPSATPTIEITTVARAADFQSFQKAHPPTVLPEFTQILASPSTESTFTPPSTAFQLNRPGSLSLLPMILGLLSLAMPIVSRMPVSTLKIITCFAVVSISMVLFNVLPLRRLRSHLAYRRRAIELQLRNQSQNEENQLLRRQLDERDSRISVLEGTGRDAENRFERELARKDREAAAAKADASAKINRLTHEKDSADGTVRQALDPDHLYGPDWTLPMVINSVKRRTVNEARICRDALLREKKKRRDTMARVEREDIVRDEETTVLRNGQRELREQERQLASQRNMLEDKELDLTIQAERDEEEAREAIDAAKEAKWRSEVDVEHVKADFARVCAYYERRYVTLRNSLDKQAEVFTQKADTVRGKYEAKLKRYSSRLRRSHTELKRSTRRARKRAHNAAPMKANLQMQSSAVEAETAKDVTAVDEKNAEASQDASAAGTSQDPLARDSSAQTSSEAPLSIDVSVTAISQAAPAIDTSAGTTSQTPPFIDASVPISNQAPPAIATSAGTTSQALPAEEPQDVSPVNEKVPEELEASVPTASQAPPASDAPAPTTRQDPPARHEGGASAAPDADERSPSPTVRQEYQSNLRSVDTAGCLKGPCGPMLAPRARRRHQDISSTSNGAVAVPPSTADETMSDVPPSTAATASAFASSSNGTVGAPSSAVDQPMLDAPPRGPATGTTFTSTSHGAIVAPSSTVDQPMMDAPHQTSATGSAFTNTSHGVVVAPSSATDQPMLDAPLQAPATSSALTSTSQGAFVAPSSAVDQPMLDAPLPAPAASSAAGSTVIAAAPLYRPLPPQPQAHGQQNFVSGNAYHGGTLVQIPRPAQAQGHQHFQSAPLTVGNVSQVPSTTAQSGGTGGGSVSNESEESDSDVAKQSVGNLIARQTQAACAANPSAAPKPNARR